MIVSNLQNSQRIEGLHPLFKPLFDYVKTHDLLHTDLGRIEIDGENLFINNVNLECVSPDKQVLELHHAILMCISCWKVRKQLVGKPWRTYKKRLRHILKRTSAPYIQILRLLMLICFRGNL